MRVILLLLAVGAATSSPVLPQVSQVHVVDTQSEVHDKATEPQNRIFEDVILEVIESILPQLDPIVVENIHVDGSNFGLDGSHITLNELSVTKISTVEIEDLSLSLTNILLQRYTLILNGHVPEIDVDLANYDLNIDLFGINFFGNGRVQIKIIRPRLDISMVVGLRLVGGIGVNVISSDVKFKLEAIETEITGLFNDEGSSAFVSLVIQHTVPDLLDFYEDEVNAIINYVVLELADRLF